MESDLPQHQRFVHDHNQHQTNSGLMRYRSAPSSYFTSAMDREFSEQFLSKPLSPETERIFSRFIDAGDGTEDSSTAQNLYEIQKHPPPPPPLQITEANTSQRQAQYLSSNYSPASQSSSSYQFPSKPPLPNQNLGTSIDGLPRMRDGGDGAGRGGVNSNLIRHNSSPAGLFANIDVESVYGGTRTGIGNYGGKEETSFSPGCRLNNYISRLPSSSSGLMSPIAEIEDKSNIIASWDDSAILSATNIQNQTQNEEGGGNRPVPLLAHHLSLPKTAAEMSVIENFLQYSESIPCKVRAKRGCATHPRSIAERVRRTKISERMRKLQELVPNMDKQTNTSDMLDLAVDYIKDLQKQVQILSENRAKCKCTSRQK